MGVPPRVQYFLYLSFLDKILTKNNLAKRGWQGGLNCVLGDATLKTTDHIFLQCSFARKMRSFFCDALGIKILPHSQTVLWNNWRLEEPMRSSRQGLDILLAAGFWCLWKERNRQIFEFHAFLRSALKQQIGRLFLLWTEHAKEGESAQIQRIRNSVKGMLVRPFNSS